MNPFQPGTEEYEIWEREEMSVPDRVYQWLGRFVAYPDDNARVAHTLWILHTHLMEAWENTPRIAFLSPEPGSGKTRALEITEGLVPRPVQAINVTPAYLFRKVGGGPDGLLPTILFDEIDTVFGEKAKDNEEVRALLNAGYRRGAVAGRCVVRGVTVTTEEIPAFSAVALAGIGSLPDTILTRCIVIKMRRRAPTETVEPYRRREYGPEAEALKHDIENWAISVFEKVNGVWPVLPPQVSDRNADIWEPLIAIADATSDWWAEAARCCAVAAVAASADGTGSLGIQLLRDLKKVFGESDRLATADILGRLNQLEESPWSFGGGYPLDANKLAKMLGEYDVNSKSIRIGDKTPKGYMRNQLEDVWSRYV